MGNSGIAIVVKRRVMAFRPGPISHRELFSKTEIVMINGSAAAPAGLKEGVHTTMITTTDLHGRS
ncbi:hypothetical protein [Desulfosediminicola sp.]|uniref:hypothetical protein n=1 Tax=Desulfosediminicola sp. TaxID=2886825 RepID=UPI003AF2F319